MFQIFNAEASKVSLKIKLNNKQDFRKALFSKNLDVRKLATQILKQSAQIYAAQIKALIDFKGLDNQNVNLVMEGSLFWDLGDFKEIVLQTLEVLGKSRKEIKLTRIRFGFILGSSKIFKYNLKKERKEILIVQELFTFFRNLNWFSQAPPQAI